MKLPQDFLDEVLSRTDIIEVAEQRITLKKTGQANYQGLCPFHSEKTPSFSVNRHKQFYYCFGCKANGNAIGFLMAYDKLSFPEAVELLANRAGLSMPETSKQTTPEDKNHIALLEQAARFYQSQLQHHGNAFKYLEQRGLSITVIEKFGLGFAPSGWRNLFNALGSSQSAKTKLQDVGLIIKKDDNWFDRFRERVMFPIHNRKGQVIAFGGRSLGQQQPKYLNSPETAVFHKSKELYGLYEVLQQHRQLDQLIIVEGYLDVISLHQYGITTAVATLGTAITANHINLLLRLTNDLIFCFDGDNAGDKAAWRALEIVLPLMNEGVNVRFLFLPTGEDPDSFVRKVGQSGFESAIAQATPLTDFFFKKLFTQTEIDTIAGKTRLVHLAHKKLRQLPKGIFQELMYERVAQLIGMSALKVHEILNEQIIPAKPPTQVSYDASEIQPTVLFAIRLLIHSPSLFEQLEIPPGFDEINLEGIEIIRKLLSILKQNPKQTTGCVLEYFTNEPVKNLLIELAAQDLLIPSDSWQKELQGAFQRMVSIDKEEKIQILLAKGGKEGLSMEEKVELQRLLAERK